MIKCQISKAMTNILYQNKPKPLLTGITKEKSNVLEQKEIIGDILVNYIEAIMSNR